MELKKNPNQDVHRKKSTNMLIGLNAALILILGLFSYANTPDKIVIKKKSANNEEVELIPPTEQEPPKAPPPPPSNEIKEIEDDSEEEETVVKDDTPDEETKVTVVPTVPTDDGDGEEKIVIDNKVYDDVDVEGGYKGGEDKLHEFVVDYYKMPTVAQELGISGLIMMVFVVEKDGSISNIKSLMPKNRELGYGLEEECIKILKLTGKNWKPASKAGKPVRSYYRFPFEIDNASGF